MSFKDLVIKNRSYRGFDETVKITRQQLEELVDCARLAPAAQNIQPLKYYLSCDSEINGIIQPLTRWAGALPDHNLPYEGHRPTAFIVICFDKTIGGEEPAKFMKDVGICAQTIMLAAAYQDINGCMIGAFSAEKVLAEETRDTLVISPEKKKLIAVKGLDDYIVIDTDDVLLICPKDDKKFKDFIAPIAMPEFEKYR